MRLRIMSNNIWWCDQNDPRWAARGEDCSAAVRAVGLDKVYAETAPDIIGLQESSAIMTDELFHNWQGEFPYAILWSRDTPIFYRSDKFELIDSHCMVYPDGIPNREGCFNNQRTKSYGVAALREKSSGKCIVFGTTHLWYKFEHQQEFSDEARCYQLGLCLDKVEEFSAKYNCPAVVVGDFNTPYYSSVVKYAFDRGYKHAHDIAVEYAAADNGYHPCDWAHYEGYEPKDFKEGIDHIIVKGEPEGFVRTFERYYSDEYLPLSDHFPVWVDVEL